MLITFDDAASLVYSEAYQYMATKGLVGTFYVTTGWPDTGSYVTWDQLTEMYNAGWDIANHTQTHLSLVNATQAEAETELTNAKNDLEAHAFLRASKHVAYPFGSRDAESDLAMDATGMLTGRLIGAGQTSIDHLNPPDLKQLPASQADDVSVETISNWISVNLAANKSLILVYHTLDTADRISRFRDVIDFIAGCGYTCSTISELYAAFP